MNLDKMRRNLYRSSPDKETRDFEELLLTASTADYKQIADQWVQDFCRRMKFKHGKRFTGVTSFQEPLYPGHQRFVIVAQIRRR